MSLLTARRSAEWIGCIDFGTALSKVAVVRRKSRAELTRQDVHPLPIAERPGYRDNPLLLPSIIYIHDDRRILFGNEAKMEALRAERSGRSALVSPKQYLSTRELKELNDPLHVHIDPTGRYKAGGLLTLFLAHLLAQAGAAAAKLNLPWPVPLRVARPAWEAARAQAAEQILQRLLLQALVIVDELGPRLSAPGGIAHEDALEALSNAQEDERTEDPIWFREVFELDTQGSASVLEATAAAAGSIRESGRRVVVVADIGGGTSDFGAFFAGFPGTDALAELRGSSHVLREAGDHLDGLLVNFILEKAGLEPEESAGRRLARTLRSNGRFNKEALFDKGTFIVDVEEDTVTVTVAEFLAEPDVKAFAWRLRLKFYDALLPAVAYAKQHSVDARVPVEILLTGGGHALPMVKGLADRPPVEWTYAIASPEFPEGDAGPDFRAAVRQLAVAVGGAVRDLPITFVPKKLREPY